MAVDAELIGSEGFNLKFKNYLRDFYIYQFKERGSDFKVKGTNNKSDVNKDVIDATFYPDAKRLQFALEQAAGVTWGKGDYVDLPRGQINKKRENKRVECVTIDSRNIENNPLFSLYQLCSESAVVPGTHFSFIYTILLYFHLGKAVQRTECKELSAKQVSTLNDYLEGLAVLIESEVKRHRVKRWSEFSTEDKEKYALEAIERFEIDHSELEEIYDYIAFNRKKIVFSDDQFVLQNDDSAFVEKNMLFEIVSHNIGFDKKQFGNKMEELARIGIVKSERRGRKIYYALSDAFLSDLIGEDESLARRFSDCVSFFSQVSSLGEIGSYIQNRLPEYDSNCMRFKHNYIKRALNDYNNIDLLHAIKNDLCAVIEYRNASQNDLEYQRIICYPIEIRESVTDGRQYLIYYHPNFRSVSAVRIEFIDSVILGELPKAENYYDDIARAKELVLHTWGTAFDKFQEGNVKSPIEYQCVRVVVSFSEQENFIKARLQREIRNRASIKEVALEEYGKCIEVIAEVANPWEMLQWLRSYTTRVVLIEINGEAFGGFTKDVIRTYESYIEPTQRISKNLSSRKGKSLLQDEVPKDFIQVDSLHNLLFNEIYGVSFNNLGKILFSIIAEGSISEEKIKQLKRTYSGNFSEVLQREKREEQVTNFLNSFVSRHEGRYKSFFSFTNDDAMPGFLDLIPLSSIEIQWLINMLNNPLARCFLSDNEKGKMLDWLGDMNLFNVNEVVLHDQYIGVEEIYKGPDLCKSFQNIVNAIRTNTMVKIKYESQYGRKSNYVCSPVFIEYSKRDNRFRVRAVSKSNVAKTFNFERIIGVTIMKDKFDKTAAKKIIETHFKECERELVIFFNETRNIPDRILTEFSCFKKKCVKWGNDRYRMTLYYDNEDKREILVRLLSYGSLINVFNDTGDVRHELIERLENQLELTNSMDLIFVQKSEGERDD